MIFTSSVLLVFAVLKHVLPRHAPENLFVLYTFIFTLCPLCPVSNVANVENNELRVENNAISGHIILALFSLRITLVSHYSTLSYGGWFVPFRLFVISRRHNEGAITKRRKRKDEKTKAKRRKDEITKAT